MSTDFDERVRAHLRDAVQQMQPDRDLANRIEAATVHAEAGMRVDHLERSPRRGLAPILAAAAVVAVAVGVAVAVNSARSHHSLTGTPPPTPSATTSAPAPTSTPTTPSPTGRARTSAKASGPTSHTVSLGGARISLPAGWAARNYQSTQTPQAWCLAPSGANASACPVLLETMPTPWSGQPVEPDSQGGLYLNPQSCLNLYKPDAMTAAAIRNFGGRPAVYHRWSYDCQGVGYAVEQYVVDTGPGYVLVASHTTNAISAAMQHVAASSALPSASTGLPLADLGIVQAVKAATGTYAGKANSPGYLVTIRRVIVGPNNTSIPISPATATYFIPEAAVPPGLVSTELKVGKRLLIQSDGTGHNVTGVNPF